MGNNINDIKMLLKKREGVLLAVISAGIIALLLVNVFVDNNKITGLITLSLDPAEPVLTKGSILRLDINARNAQELAGIQLSIGYNPEVLSYSRVVEGDFLKMGNAATVFLNTLDASQPGLIKNLAIVKIGGGSSGNGLIASVYFNVINTGQSSFSLSQVLLSDNSGNSVTIGVIDTTDVTIVESSDSDADGALDPIDRCPFTNSVIRVNKHGCPLPRHSSFSEQLTTNLYDVDLRNFTGFKIGVQNYGQIDFGDNRIVLVENISDVFVQVDLDSIITFFPHRVIVRANTHRSLNVPSIITLFDITNITNPIIKRDGALCTECRIISFNNNVITFTVPHYTEYSVEEGSVCGDFYCSSLESCSNCPNDCGSCLPAQTDTGDAGSSGRSGGSSGSGGGGGVLQSPFVCNHEWQCSTWSSCVNGWQIRQCDFVKVPQHYSKGIPCQSINDVPSTASRCQPALEIQKVQKVEEITSEDTPLSETTDHPRKSNIILYVAGLFAVLLLISIMIKGMQREKTPPLDKKSFERVSYYIREMRREGKSNMEIKARLMNAGWNQNKIEFVFGNLR